MCKKLKNILIIISLTTGYFSFAAFAQEKIIKKIEFKSDSDVPEDTLRNIIEMEEGDLYFQSNLDSDIQNLKNTTIFSKVTAEVNEDKEKKVKITFKLEKKWTFIPYFIAGSGGGTSYYSFGLFDSNFLNNLYSFNVNYKIENSESNYSISFIDNYAFKNNFINGTSANIVNKKITYFKNEQKIGFYSFEEHLLNLYSLYKFNKYLNFGGGVAFKEAIKINSQLSNDEIVTNNNNFIKDPTSYSSIGFQSRIQIGKINYQEISQEGILVNNINNSYVSQNSNDENFNDENFQLLGFLELPKLNDSYFGTRIGLQSTNSRNPVNEFYLGGLDKIRGFNYTQLTGRNAYYQNVELRFTLYKNSFIAFQIVPFFDYGNTTEQFDDLFHNIYSSVGLGIRIPLMKINKIALRLDYATTMAPFKMNGFSFGLLQFF
ncbi:POTRA domain-containing protein [Pigmentibacter sp. JX0631]|uniref:POTRA domain-containing protein n=1 Tax=Pigmentibacter sp. JX0631 TaxID=2976982 RepID=UPI00246931FF|nr:POTRA domain-containing protein [Pigmentibacter sp. JX0631]WGL59874.1 POTRA domain-containing protein [Pigmentibacter sp. JX0631]